MKNLKFKEIYYPEKGCYKNKHTSDSILWDDKESLSTK